jgi:hypothetical protein
MRACAFDELLPDPSRLRTRIEDEYKPACLAEDVGGGYMGNMQNCVSSSITKGIKSLVSPMMRPGLGPSRIHRLFLSANLREEHSRYGWDHPSVVNA